MAAQCLATIGVEATAEAVARYYGRRDDGARTGADAGALDAWLVDTVDADAAEKLAADGWRAAAAPTLMTDVPATARIAAEALALVGR
jgi:LPPG:FO 2-phospho-L-lactate transferase